ncbi:hypothetical protein OC842_005873 [Tilletia horrida]|uniref:Uncharacterized protein n=1 Tax=Tilletia horrida TaxID=155126 RepID=A0AAN6G6K1_9BASI|nr:hypothetical protein OC842_005873 [Tilletia horrida]
MSHKSRAAATGAPAGKRRRIDEAEQADEAILRAGERVFAIPELLREIGSYLMRDRIDLLALGAVNRSCRQHVLPLWVCHLDVPLSTADKRASLFGSNPQLLRYVKYLRIWDDIAQYRGYKEASDRSSLVRHLDLCKVLLGILGGQTTSADDFPRIDLAIRLCDVDHFRSVLQLFPRLMQNIVSLRIFPSSAGVFVTSRDSVISLSLFVNHIQATARTRSTKGIITFAYAFEVIPCSKSRLQSIQITAAIHDKNDPSPISPFLTAHHQLEDLTIFAQKETAAFAGSLPSLRRCSVSLKLDTAAVGSAHMVSFSSGNASTPALSKLRIVTGTVCRSFFKTLADCPHKISHVILSHEDAPSGTEFLESVSNGFGLSNGPVEAALTCIEVNLEDQSLARIASAFRMAFQAGRLQNLAELQLIYQGQIESHVPAARMAQVKENEIGAVVTDFLGARRLRILRLGDGTSFGFSSYTMLDSHVFPPALEYLAWRDFTDSIPQYFRFVPTAQRRDSLNALHAPLPAHSKHGRLQRVPSIFRQPITRDGVWTRHYFAPERMATVLDHIPETPQFCLT